MAAKKASGTSDTSKQPNCSWSDADEAIILRVLKDQKDRFGNQSGAGWKRPVWTSVELALQTEGVLVPGSGPKTWSKCQDHYSGMKKQFLEVHALRNASGFGWDEGTKRVVATDSVWEAYLKTSKPGIAKWRNTSYPFYDEMHYLVNGVVAIGSDVFHPGVSPATTVKDTSDEDTETEHEHSGVRTDASGIADSADAAEDDNPATKTPAPRKRTRAPTETPSPSASTKRPRRGRRHTTQAASILGVGDALTQIATALTSSGDQATPVRRKKALELVDKDGEYSSDEEDKIIALFSENMAVADTYSSIVKKSKRVKFVRDKLSKLSGVVDFV